MYPVYLRGQAYLMEHDGKKAAAEFQKILDHPGIVLNFPLGALARLGLARAYAVEAGYAAPGSSPASSAPANDDLKTKARAAYQDFFDLWKDADTDIPILKDAKRDYAKLR